VYLQKNQKHVISPNKKELVSSILKEDSAFSVDKTIQLRRKERGKCIRPSFVGKEEPSNVNGNNVLVGGRNVILQRARVYGNGRPRAIMAGRKVPASVTRGDQAQVHLKGNGAGVWR